MDVTYLETYMHFEIGDELKSRGITDKGSIINIETLEDEEGKSFYRVWYWVMN